MCGMFFNSCTSSIDITSKGFLFNPKFDWALGLRLVGGQCTTPKKYNFM